MKRLITFSLLVAKPRAAANTRRWTLSCVGHFTTLQVK